MSQIPILPGETPRRQNFRRSCPWVGMELGCPDDESATYGRIGHATTIIIIALSPRETTGSEIETKVSLVPSFSYASFLLFLQASPKTRAWSRGRPGAKGRKGRGSAQRATTDELILVRQHKRRCRRPCSSGAPSFLPWTLPCALPGTHGRTPNVVWSCQFCHLLTIRAGLA